MRCLFTLALFIVLSSSASAEGSCDDLPGLHRQAAGIRRQQYEHATDSATWTRLQKDRKKAWDDIRAIRAADPNRCVDPDTPWNGDGQWTCLDIPRITRGIHKLERARDKMPQGSFGRNKLDAVIARRRSRITDIKDDPGCR